MDNYFHTDDSRMVQWLANVMQKAADEGHHVRILTDSNGDLKVKVGEGCWTAPFRSTPDPHRDRPLPREVASDSPWQPMSTR